LKVDIPVLGHPVVPATALPRPPLGMSLLELDVPSRNVPSCWQTLIYPDLLCTSTVHDGQRIFLRVAAEGRRGRGDGVLDMLHSIILKLLQQGMGRNSSSSKAFLHVIC